MTSFGPPKRASKDIKRGEYQMRGRYASGGSYKEAPNGARLTSYTEKSLLVVKDYVFLEKNQNKDGPNFGEAFHGMPDSVNVPRYMSDTARSLARRDNAMKKRQKTWLPNGGGIKPYNAAEVLRMAAPEACIVNVKAVKPRVDTWFRPKYKLSISPVDAKLNRTKETSPRKSTPHSPETATTVVPYSSPASIEPAGTRRSARNDFGPDENKGDSAVKNLTSYWNDHLKRHPFTLSLPQNSQKPEDVNGRRGRSGDWRKIAHNLQASQESRPRSVGSDGVVQEHTLVPSKVLADKKMSSVEDIITFVRRSNAKKVSPRGRTNTETHWKCSPSRPEEEPLQRTPDETCENEPPLIPAPPPSPENQRARKPISIGNSTKSNGNSRKSNESSSKSNESSRKSNDSSSKSIDCSTTTNYNSGISNNDSRRSRLRNQHRQPLFVVRLHTRWLLALKVLALAFRPMIEAWKWNVAKQEIISNESTTQKYEGDKSAVISRRPAYNKDSDRSQKSNLRLNKKDSSQISRSSGIGRIKKLARRGMSNTLKFLLRTKRWKYASEDVIKTAEIRSETCFVVTDLKETQAKSCASFLTGRKPTFERTPIVTEPVAPWSSSSASGPVVVYAEDKPSTTKSASLEVLPRGLRMSLYVEYQLLVSFVVVQSTLFLIVVFIKWLQEYTA